MESNLCTSDFCLRTFQAFLSSPWRFPAFLRKIKFNRIKHFQSRCFQTRSQEPRNEVEVLQFCLNRKMYECYSPSSARRWKRLTIAIPALLAHTPDNMNHLKYHTTKNSSCWRGHIYLKKDWKEISRSLKCYLSDCNAAYPAFWSFREHGN